VTACAGASPMPERAASSASPADDNRERCITAPTGYAGSNTGKLT
jgi:hypothetical protein